MSPSLSIATVMRQRLNLRNRIRFSIGWGVLADVSGREVIVGAVTKPWQANVAFRALPPDRFAAFDEPGYGHIHARTLGRSEKLHR
jgi:hypothetical protein